MMGLDGILGQLVALAITLLPKDILTDPLDSFLDGLELKIKSSPGKVDDALLLPIISKIRNDLHIDPEGKVDHNNK